MCSSSDESKSNNLNSLLSKRFITVVNNLAIIQVALNCLYFSKTPINYASMLFLHLQVDVSNCRFNILCWIKTSMLVKGESNPALSFGSELKKSQGVILFSSIITGSYC